MISVSSTQEGQLPGSSPTTLQCLISRGRGYLISRLVMPRDPREHALHAQGSNKEEEEEEEEGGREGGGGRKEEEGGRMRLVRCLPT